MGEQNFQDGRDALQRSIERDQERLREAVHDLTGAARAELGLGEHIQRAPLEWLLGGLLFGLFLGSAGGGQRKNAR